MRKPRLTWGAWLEVGKTQVASRAWQMLEVGTSSWSELQPCKPYTSDGSAASSGSAPFRLCGCGQLVQPLWSWSP